jgi:hypothetical protein
VGVWHCVWRLEALCAADLGGKRLLGMRGTLEVLEFEWSFEAFLRQLSACVVMDS